MIRRARVTLAGQALISVLARQTLVERNLEKGGRRAILFARRELEITASPYGNSAGLSTRLRRRARDQEFWIGERRHGRADDSGRRCASVG